MVIFMEGRARKLGALGVSGSILQKTYFYDMTTLYMCIDYPYQHICISIYVYLSLKYIG